MYHVNSQENKHESFAGKVLEGSLHHKHEWQLQWKVYTFQFKLFIHIIYQRLSKIQANEQIFFTYIQGAQINNPLLNFREQRLELCQNHFKSTCLV